MSEPTMVKCEDCDGSGQVECWQCGAPDALDCDECDGTGEIEQETNNEEENV